MAAAGPTLLTNQTSIGRDFLKDALRTFLSKSSITIETLSGSMETSDHLSKENDDLRAKLSSFELNSVLQSKPRTDKGRDFDVEAEVAALKARCASLGDELVTKNTICDSKTSQVKQLMVSKVQNAETLHSRSKFSTCTQMKNLEVEKALKSVESQKARTELQISELVGKISDLDDRFKRKDLFEFTTCRNLGKPWMAVVLQKYDVMKKACEEGKWPPEEWKSLAAQTWTEMLNFDGAGDAECGWWDDLVQSFVVPSIREEKEDEEASMLKVAALLEGLPKERVEEVLELHRQALSNTR